MVGISWQPREAIVNSSIQPNRAEWLLREPNEDVAPGTLSSILKQAALE
jgi:hypothetical protein